MKDQYGVPLALLKACGESFDSCFVVADIEQEDQPLVYINDHFCAVTGYDRDEIIGRNCRFLQGDGTDKDVVKRIRGSIDNAESCYYDTINYHKDGTIFWNRLVLLPVKDQSDKVKYFIGIQQDVTEQKEAQKGESLSQTIANQQPTGEIAQAIENPLTQVIDALRALPYLSQGGEESEAEFTRVANDMAGKITAICEKVRSFS